MRRHVRGALTPTKPERKLGGVTGKGFKPGQSGNPGGKPKGYASFRELLMSKHGQDAAGLFTRLEKLATSSDESVALGAIKLELAYLLGQPDSRTTLASDPEHPLRITFGGRYRPETGT